MALGKYTGSAVTFANLSFKEGVFFTGKKDARESHNFVTGVPVAFNVVPKEYEGEQYHEAQVTLEDSKDSSRIVVTCNAGTFGGGQLVGLILRAVKEYPGQELRLNAWKMEAGDKMADGTLLAKGKTGVSGWVGKTRIQPLYAGGAERLPDAPKVKVSGKEMADMTPVIEAIAETAGELIEALSAVAAQDAPAEESINAEQAMAAAQRQRG